MNMKKTIAAVAAGAMAVSAMATTLTASAVDSFGYSLVAKRELATGKSKFTLTSSVTNVDLDDLLDEIAAGTAVIDFVGGNSAYVVKEMTIQIIDESNNGNSMTYTYSTDKGELRWNPNLTNTDFTFVNELHGFQVTGEGTVTIAVTLNVEEKTAATYNTKGKVNDAIGLGTIKINFDDSDGDMGKTTPTIVTVHEEAAKKTYEIPLETGPSDNVNIFWFLQNNSCRATDKKYTNVVPVINDAIENNESITFTFKTATKKIQYIIVPDSFAQNGRTVLYDQRADAIDPACFDTLYNSYQDAIKNAGGNAARVVAIYTQDADKGEDTYMAFGEHLYNGTYEFYEDGLGWAGFGRGEDYYGYNEWTSLNLFGGALVVNENLTMSLSDVDYFDWKNTSLSFDWDAIEDNAYTSNDYAKFVHTMKLATSIRWYWDYLQIEVVEGTADDASSSAGVTGDDETLDDDGDDDGDITLDDDGDDDDGEEPAGDDEKEEPASAPNPTTGNAPVALAVIPVALAAAAIVAKKRS